MNGLPDKTGETRKDVYFKTRQCQWTTAEVSRILFKRLKSLVLNPVFRWVCFAVFCCAVMFDGSTQTLKQSVKSVITIRSEVQNLQVYKLKAGFSYFLFCFYSIFTLSYIFYSVCKLSLHGPPAFYTQSAFYT